MTSRANKKSDLRKTNLILASTGGFGILVVIVIMLFIFHPWKNYYLTGKYEEQFKDYLHDCTDVDELGDMNTNSVIGEVYGSWVVVACTCSYLEYHNYYGDKDLPKTTVPISFIPKKEVKVYDAASIFTDKSLQDNIQACIEKEYDSWEAEYDDDFRKKYGYSLQGR